ncbi:hypothetical protein WA026_004288 [Henosepilachna vigintioctopunctata]|uniref:Uncharacterized protein n=1 Tax=Henosepilachna vigintioctopunctata TaxID=420089 RepID=A0AAW1VAU6_9CUCU
MQRIYLLSRGTTGQALQSSDIWWHGPKFLTQDEEFWPPQDILYSSPLEIPEKQKTAVIASVSTYFADQSIFEKYSNLNKSLRVVAHVFIHNSKKKTH